jgi:3-dehydroquinate synthetase
MIAACKIGTGIGVTDDETAQRVIRLVESYGPLPKVSVDGKRIVQRLASDKKAVGGVPHFILATAVGRVEVVNTVSSRSVIQAVNSIRTASGS